MNHRNWVVKSRSGVIVRATPAVNMGQLRRSRLLVCWNAEQSILTLARTFERSTMISVRCFYFLTPFVQFDTLEFVHQRPDARTWRRIYLCLKYSRE